MQRSLTVPDDERSQSAAEWQTLEMIDLAASERGTVAAGCLLTIASAAVTCLLLFINGSLVMAILVAIVRSTPAWFREPAVLQFLLFAMPVVLTVLQWMMIDYVRTRFRRNVA